jgi:uncharacterized protein YkwD
MRALLLVIAACAAPAPGPPGAPASDRDPATREAEAIATEINRLRADPRAYAAELRRQRGFYRGALLELPGAPAAIRTREGVAALDHAIAELERAAPAPRLRLSRGLMAAAADHANALGPAGRYGHRGADGSHPEERMERHGRLAGRAGENIMFGVSDPRRVVADLVIDDGVPGRGHRRNLLDPEFRLVGVACAPHRAMRRVCVIDFAESFGRR